MVIYNQIIFCITIHILSYLIYTYLHYEIIKLFRLFIFELGVLAKIEKLL